MRNTYLVCYDIRDDKRLRKVFRPCVTGATTCSTRSLSAS